MRILLIEDDTDIRTYLAQMLDQQAFAVDTATNGITGLQQAQLHTYDIIIADYALPGKNGFEICKELRAFGNTTPIIMLTAADSINHKLLGFAVGADDYMVKPFSFEELHARIRSVLRRSAQTQQQTLSFDTLCIDCEKQIVSKDGEAIHLTRTEYEILVLLMKKIGTIISRPELLDAVWNTNYNIKSNSIETHIANLRKKIDTGDVQLLHTIPYRGYKIDYKK